MRKNSQKTLPGTASALVSTIPLLTLQPEDSLKNEDSINLFVLLRDILKRFFFKNQIEGRILKEDLQHRRNSF